MKKRLGLSKHIRIINKDNFKSNDPTYGDHGGGTQPPVYLDKKTGKPIPYKKTFWSKKAEIKKLLNSLIP